MPLAALANYCESLRRRGILPRAGWGAYFASYALVIDRDGTLVNIHDIQDKKEGARLRSHKERKHMILPYRTKHSNGLNPFFIADNSKFLMGFGDVSPDSKNADNPQRIRSCFEASRDYHIKLLENTAGEHSKSLVSYFKNWDPETIDEYHFISDEVKKGLLKATNIVFEFGWDNTYAHEDPEIIAIWDGLYHEERIADCVGYAQCCVTGRQNVPIERIHPPVTGIRGATTAGAYLVSFGALKEGSAYSSFNRSQGENAPVAQDVAEAYGSALRYLFVNNCHHRIVNDVHVLFWANNDDQDQILSKIFSFSVFGRQPSLFYSEEDETIARIVDAIMRGDRCPHELEQRIACNGAPFFVLRLFPHASRLAVLGFEHGDFGEIMDNIRRHYEDTKINVWRNGEELQTGFSLNEILKWLGKIKQNGDMKEAKIPQNLREGILNAMITDSPYPTNALQYAVHRITRDKEIHPSRIAIIKGSLIRGNSKYKECATVSLNPECNESPYLLGQLFWTYEAAQRAAIPDIKRSLSERVIVGAMTQPRVIFPSLATDFIHHVAKLKKNENKRGLGIHLEKTAEDLWCRLGTDPLPINQSIEGQGAFLMGYYHAKRDYYTTKSTTTADMEQ